jgi:hypothetical protein
MYILIEASWVYDDLYTNIIQVLSCLENLQHSNLFSTVDFFYLYWYIKGQKLYSIIVIQNNAFVNITSNA